MTSTENGGDEEHHDNIKSDVEVLSSKPLKIQSKRYYVDVKQVRQRKFIKLVESLPNGGKNRLTLPMPIVGKFKETLTTFLDFYDELDPTTKEEKEPASDPPAQEEPSEVIKLKSDMLRGLGKRFYFDLKENQRGRFLRISQATRNAPRNTIAIPGEGIVEIRDALADAYEEYGSDDNDNLSDDQGDLPRSEEMNTERKKFYFDCGQNTRGRFLRISEVTNDYRSSVTIPSQGLNEFADIIVKLAEKMDI